VRWLFELIQTYWRIAGRCSLTEQSENDNTNPTERTEVFEATKNPDCSGLISRIYPRAVRTRPGQAQCYPESQQLIRIDVDGSGDIFGEREFGEGFADQATEAHNGFAADQDVKTELAL
jgi:hypothetical protein